MAENIPSTGATEGFYRRAWGAPPINPSSQQSSSPPRRSFFGSAPPADAKEAAVRQGSLKPPGELGVQVSHTESFASSHQPARQQPQIQAHPNIVRQRRLSQEVIRRSQDPATAEALVEAVRAAAAAEEQEPASVTSFSYRGMEVIFAATSTRCYGMCSRTRLVFQTLDLPRPPTTAATTTTATVVCIRSNPLTGQIVVALSDGRLQSYEPQPADPLEVAFGRYRWWNGAAMNCAEIFYASAETAVFSNRALAAAEHRLQVTLADDYKLLVAHRDQVAVLDATPINSKKEEVVVVQEEADLLWTTRLPGLVVTAALSGDGQAIAVVLSRAEEDDAEADGVHTFERDLDDGSHMDQQAPTIERPSLRRATSSSVGILYKPGPFLVHSAPVTRLSFRGLGHVTSCIDPSEKEQGNDLLLTYCAGNCTARIFGQNNWKPLTEWKTPPSTRVDWVKGIAAFTLGDLESQKKQRQSSAPPSRRPSSASLISEEDSIGAISESLGKRHHFHSIPSHSAPSSNAGAWITEVTFQGTFPAFRLSRLTYLKRGVDDLNPTLFETVAVFLPAGAILGDCILDGDMEGLSIEAIWPAWNPWLSQSADVASNETLRGSAMASLGLSSAPGASAGGFFGESLLGTTQIPPCEIRMVASHPLTGQVVVLEMPLFGDQHFSSLELGSPVRSVLSLSDLDVPLPSADGKELKLRKGHSASTNFDSSRLIAKVEKSSRAISLTWQRPGTMSLLPAGWLPGDVEAQFLSESNRFQDESLVPAPLALPQIQIPEKVKRVTIEGTVHTVLWWPEQSFGGTPLLLGVLSSGTILAFELPPPWNELEPQLPQSLESTLNDRDANGAGPGEGSFDDEMNYPGSPQSYTVLISPDPEYGLGLRLESQVDGMPAVAGSFKKHPLNGENLPAEKTGMINLGDELVSANDVNVEDKTFDDIIAAVREQGAACAPGNPMRMTFRRPSRTFSRSNSSASDALSPEGLMSPRYRGMEEMLGVTPNVRRRKLPEVAFETAKSQKVTGDAGHSYASPNGLKTRSVVGVLPNLISGDLMPHDSDQVQPLFSLLSSSMFGDETRRSALLFSSNGNSIHARLLKLGTAASPDKATATDLGSCSFDEEGPSSSSDNVVKAMEVIQTESESCCLAVCGASGAVRLVFASMNKVSQSVPPALSFRQYKIFWTAGPAKSNIFLRSCSIETLAVMQPESDGTCKTITVWTARPHPGCHVGTAASVLEAGEEGDHTDYCSVEVRIESCFESAADEFVDFSFLRSGFLDSSPSLVAFSLKGAIVYQKLGGKPDWVPITQISYCALLGSAPSVNAEVLNSNMLWIHKDRHPRDAFPHLIPALQSLFPATDENNYLRADWHPDSLLARICTDPRGAKFALRKHVRELYIWLCSEAREISDEHMEGSLIVAPFSIGENEGRNEELAERTGSIIPSLASGGASEDVNGELLRKLQASLLLELSASKPVQGFTSDIDSKSKDTFNDVTPILRSMSHEDILVLWGLGELILESPDFESLDVCGQLFAFTAALFRRIKEAPTIDGVVSTRNARSMPTFLQRKTSSAPKTDVDDSKSLPAVASAGCLAALLSNTQSRLLESCRQAGQKLTWSLARELKIPFWMRSDAALARVAEEIGQSIFREKKDIMECALFFIVARKMRTLRNLAATDSSISGRTFHKFLNAHDFSSERGRRAAEKNAFSLLRKCRYEMASAFFLLAEPPALTLALETILTKMQDVNLAFLVARLMGCSLSEARGSLGGGALGGSGSVFGGGGGYAGGGFSVPEVSGDVENPFVEWKPKLTRATRKLLVDRLIPLSVGDNALVAVQLLWLEKEEEASWWVSGGLKASYGKNGKQTTYDVVDDASQRGFIVASGADSKPGVPLKPSLAIRKVNALVDFIAGPVLLKAMNASVRAQFASSLIVSEGLTSRGLEAASIRSILHYADTLDLEEKEDVCESASAQAVTTTSQASVATASSIFDAFDAPPPRSVPSALSQGMAASSIFDSFDAPPPKPAPAPSQGMAASSIFDSFDAPSPKPAPAPSQEMASSLFDSFDGPPPKSIPRQSTTPQATSSIFSDYDPPPQSGSGIQSSISDSIDAAPQAPTAQSGGMQSSIFDAFDAGPPVQKPQVPTADPLSSSIFDSFGQPPSSNGRKDFQNGEDLGAVPSTADIGSEYEPEDLITITKSTTPALWVEWRGELVLLAASRRMLREVASVLALIHGDPSVPSLQGFYRRQVPLIPSGASGLLQLHCDAKGIIGRVQDSLYEICTASGLEQTHVLNTALRLLGPASQHHRALFAVILYAAVGNMDKAEDIVRAASSALIDRCHDFAFSFDDLVHQRKTKFHVSSQLMRREAARVSWQLEICMWINRGGGLPLSGIAVREAIIAVRVGLLIASWNQNYKCHEAMIRSNPDCLSDEAAGRHLWTSLKIMPLAERKADAVKKTNSGGWEFLVDCRRSQATEMLRERPTGCFIIRPHTEDRGVFTLSFKTNLLPDADQEADSARTENSSDELDIDTQTRPPRPPSEKKVRKDDVVQHAIIRLSDSGFRCGSFGPFTSLIDLLEAVSSSLPFKLRFDKPPINRVIKEEGSQPSPNAVFLRRLALTHADSLASSAPMHESTTHSFGEKAFTEQRGTGHESSHPDDEVASFERQKSIGLFLELLVLSSIRKQLSGVASVEYDDSGEEDSEPLDGVGDDVSVATSDASLGLHNADHLAVASRMLRPLLTWCRAMETFAVVELAPDLKFLSEATAAVPVNLTESPDAIEISPLEGVSGSDGGDAVLRRMIQRGSGVDFSTLRLVDGGECTLVVLFSKKEAVQWLLSSGSEQSELDAVSRLERMEQTRVIEAIDLNRLPLKKSGQKEASVHYRFVDPWEVESLASREGETRSATLGRSSFLGFSLGKASMSAERILRLMGGVPLLELWTAAKGGVALTKAIASVHPPWERSAGGDLRVTNGTVTEPPPFANSIREHLYRNAVFRRLHVPQRFLALVQVELLDLKNLTSPGGSLSLSVYALLRLKRSGSGALTNKARTLDSAATHPVKLGKTSGPNAPASWGSVVRFRFPLPEDVAIDGTSYDGDREILFKGPPGVLQVSVYEKKLLVDHSLGTADIRIDGLWAGDQLEEWVPLRSEKHGISWFARIRLTLRFELMCLAKDHPGGEMPPSVGIHKIEELSRAGGSAYEDSHKRSMSSPDLLTYFESMVY